MALMCDKGSKQRLVKMLNEEKKGRASGGSGVQRASEGRRSAGGDTDPVPLRPKVKTFPQSARQLENFCFPRK
jgi:hypothetical protein